MKKVIFLTALLIPMFILTGCNNEEKEKIANEVETFQPLKKYTVARAEEYLVEEKTAEEIASEVFKEQLGILNNKETSFEISGNIDSNIFVQSAVSDGKNIPTVPGFSDKDIQKINDSGGVDVWAEDNETDFNELLKNRDIVVEKLDGNSEKKLTDSIQDAIDYQEKIK